MMEDYLHMHGISALAAQQRALQAIDAILQESGMSCSGLGLPDIDGAQIMEAAPEFDIALEEMEAVIQMAKLNSEQRMLVDSILQDLDEIRDGHPPRNRAYFLEGPGGSGKTMCYNTLISYCRSQGVKVASTSWTGIAATLLRGGRTCHNLFKLPVPIVDTSVCHVSPTSSHAEVLRSVTLFIIDEASMVPANALGAIDRMLRDICGLPDIPFAGKIFLLGGDFHQVLLVVPRQPRTVIVENCLKIYLLWPLFKVIMLAKNMQSMIFYVL